MEQWPQEARSRMRRDPSRGFEGTWSIEVTSGKNILCRERKEGFFLLNAHTIISVTVITWRAPAFVTQALAAPRGWAPPPPHL